MTNWEKSESLPTPKMNSMHNFHNWRIHAEEVISEMKTRHDAIN